MTLSPGTKLGPYEIVAPLGAGGMGEVYRARDPRLGRDVAIKALPEALAQDPEPLARFEREAKLLASLNHPNVAGIHGLELVEGHRYLVLELVEGETLARRIARGALPVDEALDVCRQVAAGVEAAHEAGVVHRDLKPGNVMLKPDGTVKVLDFGLAKSGAAQGASSDPSLSASPTMTYAATNAGVILGTAAYMSPEQARGKSADRRTDIWSFGCVLYECLTARQAFAGETVSDIVARILQTEPEWSALPEKTPEKLRALMGRCLQKDVKRRQRDIGDVRIEMEDMIAARASSSGTRAAARPGASRALPPWVLPVLTALAAAAATWLAPRFLTKPPAQGAARFEVAGPRNHALNGDAANAQLSPDGRMIAMIVADSSGTTRIWVRRLDTLVPRALPGTENSTLMFWAPDSRDLAFFAGDLQLSRIAVAGGDPERICDVKTARGGSWNRQGVILLAPYSNGGIYRVPAGGGEPVQLTHPDSARGETGHRFPWFLPDGRHFLFTSVPAGSDGKGGILVGSLDGSPPKPLMRGESGAIYCAPGWLLTTRNGMLVAQRFDARSRKLRGEPIPLGDAPQFSNFSGAPVVSTSNAGTLAYMTQGIVRSRFAWLDLEGRETAGVPVPPGLYFRHSLSPDGRRVAVMVGNENPTARTHVAVADLERGVLTRISEPAESGGTQVWSPDGRRVAYLDDLTQIIAIRSLVDGGRRTLMESDRAYKRIDAWSRDGKHLLIERLDAATKWDLWLLPVDGDAPPRPLVRSPANENNAALSPDGRWVAYVGDESGGTGEVFVQPCESMGMKYQVTTGGGFVTGWSSDGKRLCFASQKHPQRILQAEVQAGPEFSLGPARLWFHQPAEATWWDTVQDDRRVLALLPAEKAPPQTVTLIQNWQSALRKP